MGLIILQGYQESGNNVRVFWDTNSKAVGRGGGYNNSDGFNGYSRSTLEVIDVYNVGNTLYVVYPKAAISSDPTTAFVSTVTMQNKIVLHFAKDTPIIVWDKASKTVTELLQPSPVARYATYSNDQYTEGGFHSFDISTSTELESYCEGTTAKTVYPAKNGVSYVNSVTTVAIENSVACGYVAPDPDIIVTEKIKIKIDKACYKNPVLLLWKNKFGGFDRYMFHHTQTRTKKTESLGTVKRNFYYLENQNVISKDIGTLEDNTMVVGADNLTLENYNAIVNHLPGSPQVYIQEKNGKITSVDIRPSTWSYDTSKHRGTIELELILPETFTIKN